MIAFFLKTTLIISIPPDNGLMRQIKICPGCGSTNVKIAPAGLDLAMTRPDICMDCRNLGIFPEIDPEDAKSFRKYLDSAKDI